ncbi:MAG: vancomycin resistance protein, partial [Peptococcaceae bacterium]|nr:vancomycin resistance protein [Peptococcaceae bacterium]
QIKNETAQEYQLLAQVDDTELKGEWRAEQPPSQKYEVYESAHRITQEWWGGYMRHNEIRRRVFMEERQTGDEWIVENHAVMMYEPLLGESESAK